MPDRSPAGIWEVDTRSRYSPFGGSGIRDRTPASFPFTLFLASRVSVSTVRRALSRVPLFHPADMRGRSAAAPQGWSSFMGGKYFWQPVIGGDDRRLVSSP